MSRTTRGASRTRAREGSRGPGPAPGAKKARENGGGGATIGIAGRGTVREDLTGTMKDSVAKLARACEELAPAVLTIEGEELRRATQLDALRGDDGGWRVRLGPFPGDAPRAARATIDFAVDGQDLFVSGGPLQPGPHGTAWLAIREAPRARPARAFRVVPSNETVVAVYVAEQLGLGRSCQPVVDIGLRGLRLVSSVDLPAGTRLRDLVVLRREEVVRRAEGTVLRSTPFEGVGGRRAYWCSVALSAPAAVSGAGRDDDPADDCAVHDPERVRAILWALGDVGAAVTLRLGGERLQARLQPGRGNRAELPELACAVDAPTGTPYAVVQVQAELFGSGYRFHARVLGRAPGLMRLQPEAALVEVHRRREERVALGPDAGARVTYRHPLDGRLETRRLVDVSLRGFGFAAESADDALWPGLPLDAVRVELPGLAFDVAGAAVRAVVDGRCGVELTGLSEAAAGQLQLAMVRLNGQPLEVHDARELDALLAFHGALGLLEPSMEQNLEASLPAIRDGWQRAHELPEGLMRTLVGRWRGAIAASQNAVRAYDTGWVFQHSAVASSSVPAHSGMLQGALIQMIVARGDGEYLSTFVNDEAKSHHAGFAAFFNASTPEHRGGTRFVLWAAPAAPAVPAPTASDVRALKSPGAAAPATPRAGLTPCAAGERAPTDAETGTEAGASAAAAALEAGDVTLDRLEGCDEILVERAATRLLDPVCVAALGLQAGRIGIPGTRTAFAAAGLERGREAWGVRRGGRLVAVLLREWASPGLSLSSLLSAGILLPVRPEEDADGSARRIAAQLAARAPLPGEPRVRFLFVPEACDAAPVEAAGFTRAGSCALYAFHRHGLREYYRHVSSRYGVVHARLRARSASPRRANAAAAAAAAVMSESEAA